jgi:hypothetical protein
MTLQEQLDEALAKWAHGDLATVPNREVNASEDARKRAVSGVFAYARERNELLAHLIKELTTGPCVLCTKPGSLRADSNRVLCQECVDFQWLTESHKNYPASVEAVRPRQQEPSDDMVKMRDTQRMLDCLNDVRAMGDTAIVERINATLNMIGK